MNTLSSIPSPPQADLTNRTQPSSSNQGSTGSTSSSLAPGPSTNSFSPQGTQRQSYLELCINTGQYTKTLSEIDLRDIRSDSDLFGRIRGEYFRLRKFRSYLWLLKPVGIHFVKAGLEMQRDSEDKGLYSSQFALQDTLRVSILQKPLSIPPEQEVDSKRYIYSPCPFGDDPPMPSDVFLHCLTCTAIEPSSAWIPRLPKKLDTSIFRFIGPINEGWGIHIIEGPNWSLIGMLNLFMIVISGVAAGLWKLYMNDFQGAFGFAAWILMVVNAVLLVYVARWNRQ
jgi:hypothetical protein